MRRCMVQGCSAWEFDVEVRMCRNCLRDYAQLAAAARKYAKEPVLKPDLFVTKTIGGPFYLEMQEGDKVDVLDILEDNSSVIIRTADARVGYYNLDFLATEDELTTSFVQDEAKQRREQEIREKEEQRRRELEYEEHLRQQMKQKAQADRERRVAETEQRKREAEELQRQLAEMRLREQEEEKRAMEEMRIRREEEERRKRAEQKARELEAHEAKRKWDEEQARFAEQKRLSSMPQWKRDLLARQGGN